MRQQTDDLRPRSPLHQLHRDNGTVFCAGHAVEGHTAACAGWVWARFATDQLGNARVRALVKTEAIHIRIETGVDEPLHLPTFDQRASFAIRASLGKIRASSSSTNGLCSPV